MIYLERFHRQLLLRGLNRSKSRNLIYQELALSGPLSAPELIILLRQKVSRTSIYANLNAFRKTEIIEEIRPGIFELTDRFKQHHHYFWCRICDKKVAFWDERLEKALNRLATRRGLTLEDHNLALSGLCSQCQDAHVPRQNVGLSMLRAPDR